MFSPLLNTAEAWTLIGAIVKQTNGKSHEIHHQAFKANSVYAVIVPVLYGGKPPQKRRKGETFLMNVAVTGNSNVCVFVWFPQQAATTSDPALAYFRAVYTKRHKAIK